MCTLLLAHRLFPRAPLVVAANRDEMLARRASGPRVEPGPPRVLAPRDEEAFGTWLGLNEHGLFVGVTNRAGAARDPARRSRGLLVAEALRAPDARTLHRQLGAMGVDEFNPFHLLYADGQDAFVTWSDGREVLQVEVSPGLTVVTERSLGADDRGRAEALERLFAERVAGPEPDPAALRGLLVVHGPPDEPLAGSCVHADALGYGTRSSFVYVGGAIPAATWSEGHPCRAQVVDLAPLLSALVTPG